MFKYGTPESVGIKSENIKKYIETLENANLSTHNVIIVRNNTIVYENYWKPFHKDFLHRMYSVTKSFVSIAIGFLFAGLLWCITIIGIPFGKQCFKLAKLALTPFGATV